ncbi:sensor histidine kinase [Cohnella sp. 56]|uniref:sensor histidine kinase n=1 Tax=Cohnella sp. 56 TaxID=3113722 RepID=UPI0030E7513E
MRSMRLPGLLRRLFDLGIVKKMIVGYVCIIMIPTVTFGAMYYRSLTSNVLYNYATSKQSNMEQASSTLKTNLTQLQTLSQLFEVNTNLIDYLNGNYTTDADRVYNFVKYIRPLFSYLYSGNPLIETIRLYKLPPEVPAIGPELLDVSELGDIYGQIQIQPITEGLWINREQAGRLPRPAYYVKLYNGDYSKEVGILEIDVNDRLLATFLQSLQSPQKGNLYVLADGDRIVYKEESSPIDAELRQQLLADADGGESAYKVGHSRIVSSIRLDKLQMRVVLVSKTGDIATGLQQKRLMYLAAIALLFVLLSLLYYLLAMSVTRRVAKLARHMRAVSRNKLIEYKGVGSQDEIGYLITSYNDMIRHIDELINSVHRSELLRRESAYLALQAQIKPHFLYNTLESIRMLAETNQDHDVAEMTFTLGSFLRYSMSDTKNETTLQEEIENVRRYLIIHKIRMGNRLTYTFDIHADVSRFVCPRFILQPLAENSIIHGIAPLKRPCELVISAEETEACMVIRIADNGKGIPADKLQALWQMLQYPDPDGNSGGHGLYNVSERIKLFYGKGSGLEVDSPETGGTTFTIRLVKGRTHADHLDRR